MECDLCTRTKKEFMEWTKQTTKRSYDLCDKCSDFIEKSWYIEHEKYCDLCLTFLGDENAGICTDCKKERGR
jgi:hypothetical protein